jgi:hypothetical protein
MLPGGLYMGKNLGPSYLREGVSRRRPHLGGNRPYTSQPYNDNKIIFLLRIPNKNLSPEHLDEREVASFVCFARSRRVAILAHVVREDASFVSVTAGETECTAAFEA